MFSFKIYESGLDLNHEILNIISEIDQRNMDHSWSFESWKDLLKLKDLILITALNNDQIIGYVLFLTQPIDSFAHLIQIAIEKEFRGKGLSKVLLEKSFFEINKQSIKTIQLEVSVTNEIAINLYQKMGFTTSRSIAKFYSNGEDAYIMLKMN